MRLGALQRGSGQKVESHPRCPLQKVIWIATKEIAKDFLSARTADRKSTKLDWCGWPDIAFERSRLAC